MCGTFEKMILFNRTTTQKTPENEIPATIPEKKKLSTTDEVDKSILKLK